ncbi:MAG TPA: zinc ribbon domain-containing protein [Dehalococcoidia bacterium]|nr:zinc ribbon domain-containing protein [Dehalococcoidia bacterium]
MPIYDFRCLECGKVSEVFVRGSEHVPRCPDCGSVNLKRLMSSSYAIRMGSQAADTTCCGRTERCDAPPCSTGDTCRRR